MGARGASHAKTRQIYDQLWERAYTLAPESKTQEAFLTEVLDDLNQLSENRRLRIHYSQAEISIILWLVLLVGALPTIGYTLLFAGRHGWMQMCITGAMTLLVLLSLLVTLSLQYPFTGDVSIPPKAFQDLLESFQQRLREAGEHG